MPGVACKALNSTQTVFGVDMHKQLPPPPVAVGPHVVTFTMGLAHPATTKLAPTVMAGVGNALGRQHDLGPGVYHYAVNALLPLICLGAGNKAEFGCASVSIPTGRIAVALIPMVGLNMQLDCNDPTPAITCPMPTSVCDASLNTVYAGFTLLDCVAGFVTMIADAAWVAFVSFAAGKAVGLVAGGLISGLLFVGAAPAVFVIGAAAALLPVSAALLKGTAELLTGYLSGIVLLAVTTRRQRSEALALTLGSS